VQGIVTWETDFTNAMGKFKESGLDL
jgi:hypothetical protein